MKSSKLSNLFQILASIGVLIGLIAIAVELKQNTAIATAEHTREFFLAWLDVSALEVESDIGEIVIKSIEQPDSLTADDLYKLNSWLIMIMSLYASMTPLVELGIAEEVSTMDEAYAGYLFASKYSRQWFERNRRWLGAQNEEVISRAIESTPVSTKWRRLEEYYSQP
jgi:hypothetical protein